MNDKNNLEVFKMEKEIKTVDIKCTAHFEIVGVDKNALNLRMYVDELIKNDMFTLQHHGGRYAKNDAKLCCTSNRINILSNRRNGGRVHPCCGFNCEVDFSKEEASILISAHVDNYTTGEEIDVNFRFVTCIRGMKEVDKYKRMLDEFNEKRIIEEAEATKREIIEKENAERIMDFLRS
jgi:hypothetical protein